MEHFVLHPDDLIHIRLGHGLLVGDHLVQLSKALQSISTDFELKSQQVQVHDEAASRLCSLL